MPNILAQDEIDSLMGAMDNGTIEYDINISQKEYDDLMSNTPPALISVYRQILIKDIDNQLKEKVNLATSGYDILLEVTRALTENYEAARSKEMRIK